MSKTLDIALLRSFVTVADADGFQGAADVLHLSQGVAVMATLGQTPEGLEPRYDLPQPAPLPLSLWTRQGITPVVARHVVTALRRVLTASGVADFPARGYVLAEGAR